LTFVSPISDARWERPHDGSQRLQSAVASTVAGSVRADAMPGIAKRGLIDDDDGY